MTSGIGPGIELHWVTRFFIGLLGLMFSGFSLTILRQPSLGFVDLVFFAVYFGIGASLLFWAWSGSLRFSYLDRLERLSQYLGPVGRLLKVIAHIRWVFWFLVLTALAFWIVISILYAAWSL